MPIDEVVRTIVREEILKILPTLPAAAADPDQLMTTQEVADLTSLSVGYFEIGRSKGDVVLPPHYKIGRRVMYKRGDVLAWLEKRREVVGDE